MQADIHSILKQYWGYDAFRPLQEDIIRAVLDRRDTLALLPTGGGKSVCYQLPALALPGVCLVISPLIALMKDQVQQLKKKGITSLAIHTGMSYKELMKTLELAVNQRVKVLYVSPERLQTKLFREFLPEMEISLVAVDEAHCVSQWGYDFRPSYLQISTLREHLPEVPVLALTASATSLVQKDILQQLRLRDAVVIKGSFDRENLSYSCFEESNKLARLTHILQQVQGTSIVYCRSRKKTVEVCRHLEEQGLDALYYHAGLDQEERHDRQHRWTSNQSRIMVSTNAFGMGIDKPDVRTVVHYDVPDCMENYYQEAGRAGRDRQKAYAVLLYNQEELSQLKLAAEKKFPPAETIREVYQAVANFLQIPSGTPEGLSYDFDLAAFCNNFRIDKATAINSLQILQAEGYCALNESVYSPPKVQFICDRAWLEHFEKQYPQWEALTKTLLRSYEGLFTYPVSISEVYIARTLRVERDTIKAGLLALQQNSVIQYEAQKDKPQLTLLTERVRKENIRLNMADIEKRKALALERAEKMKEYVNGKECRSVYIGRYFSDAGIRPCGICDNCLALKKRPVPVEKLTKDIIGILSSSPMPHDAIRQQLNYACDDDSFWTALHYLLSEQVLIPQPDGSYTLNT